MEGIYIYSMSTVEPSHSNHSQIHDWLTIPERESAQPHTVRVAHIYGDILKHKTPSRDPSVHSEEGGQLLSCPRPDLDTSTESLARNCIREHLAASVWVDSSPDQPQQAALIPFCGLLPQPHDNDDM